MTAWQLFWTFFLYCVTATVLGQGRLLLPPGRSSMWRVGYDTPINNNDNALTCGGLQVSKLIKMLANTLKYQYLILTQSHIIVHRHNLMQVVYI